MPSWFAFDFTWAFSLAASTSVSLGAIDIWHEHRLISNIWLKATRTLNFVRHNTVHIVVLRKLKILLKLSILSLSPLGVCCCGVGPVWPNIFSISNEFNAVLPVLSKKIIAIQLLSLVCSTNLVGCPCSNVVNTLVWRFFTRRWIIFRLFLWITSQFHHGILEPPTKINLCH